MTFLSTMYLGVALVLFAAAPNITTKCASAYGLTSPMAEKHSFAWCKYMDQTKVYFSNVDENHFAGLLFAMLALCCFLLLSQALPFFLFSSRLFPGLSLS